MDIQQQLQECQDVLQYRFQDPGLLETCLTHASVAKTRLGSNERLEFLGDAILGAVVCEMLYRRFPEFAEGELTRIKSVLVSRTMCAQLSSGLGLDRFLYLGKGLAAHGEVPQSILAAVFESIVAGVYLDGGMEPARVLIERALESEMERTVEREHSKNFKSLLQQLSQKSFGQTPIYRLLDEKGPDHSKCFKISASIGTHVYAAAWGPNKKEAEQRAAQNALYEIEGKEIPHAAD